MQVRLENEICGQLQRGHDEFAHRGFLPEGCLHDLITESAIFKELRLCLNLETLEGKKLIKFIKSDAAKVFAITLLVGLEDRQLCEAMKAFEANNFDDKCLPITLSKNRNPGDKLPMFPEMIWSAVEIKRFYYEQWWFLAPVFSNANFEFCLPHLCPLPFTLESSVSSTVSEAKIHQSHQARDTPTHVAIENISRRCVYSSDRELEEAFKREAKFLNEVRRLNHRHITHCIAAIARGKNYYFIFEWANKGNLRDYWKAVPYPVLDSSLVKDIILQLRGLAGALHDLHNYKGDRSYRHGNLKPENILCFDDGTQLGTLKLTGIEGRKHHIVSTFVRRRSPVATQPGRYDPPEVNTAPLTNARSHLYDIWSMGCIILELIIWLLYGYPELERFNTSLGEDSLEEVRYFEVKQGEDGREVAKVHRVAVSWTDHMLKDLECSGPRALMDLLDLVRTRLLVVRLPSTRWGHYGIDIETPMREKDSEEATRLTRVSAEIFRNSITDIIHMSKTDESYLLRSVTPKSFCGLSCTPRTSNPDSRRSSDLVQRRRDNWHNLKADDAEPLSRVAPKHRMLSVNSPKLISDFTKTSLYELDDGWNFITDNKFAYDLIQKIGKSAILPANHNPSRLCGGCQSLKFWAPGFQFQTDLRTISANCDFCGMLHEIGTQLGNPELGPIRFARVGSILKADGKDLPVLSIYRSPDVEAPTPIQLGLPELPKAGSRTHFNIIREWLNDCDNHPACRPSKSNRLPTRVIDVGERDTQTIRLHETQEDESGMYIALSHRWGDIPEEHFFRTLITNIEDYKVKINLQDLPDTFRDAVITTRALGFKYLWIDSICIIQGPGGDFDKEAGRMEDIFSSAYCVIAANRATSQKSGFLKPRPKRKYVTFARENMETFYVCHFIDNFNMDVLEGHLNKRGWVLQERALSRRTIYFAESQTYWECGEGVRCETLNKMENKLAAFLGDPNFPTVAMMSTMGSKIRLYQFLYRLYSRLSFKHIEDRPIAIAGLENRLIRDFSARGGYGVFDDGPYLELSHTSLLWRRGADQKMLVKIRFQNDPAMLVPSWSWMAYEGGIDYLDLPLSRVQWVEDELGLSWGQEASSVWYMTDYSHDNHLRAVARDFKDLNHILQGIEERQQIIFDDPGGAEGRPLKCVILGRVEGELPPREVTCYVLVVAPKDYAENEIYERVGVGFLSSENITLEGPGMAVKVR